MGKQFDIRAEQISTLTL